MTFTLHDMTSAEIPQVAAMSLRLRDTMGTGMTRPALATMLTLPEVTLHVARDARQRVVAFGSMRWGPVANMMASMAHPDLRIPGAVTALNTLRYNMALERGYDRISGAVRKGNQRALDFRLNDGWTITGEAEEYWMVEKVFDFHQVA